MERERSRVCLCRKYKRTKFIIRRFVEYCEYFFACCFAFYKNIFPIVLFLDLLPKNYEFRVTTVTDPDPLWYNYIVPLSNNHSGASITSELNQTNIPPMAPNNFKGEVNSTSSVLLKWSDPDNLAKYFTICYFPVSETKKECDEKLLTR